MILQILNKWNKLSWLVNYSQILAHFKVGRKPKTNKITEGTYISLSDTRINFFSSKIKSFNVQRIFSIMQVRMWDPIPFDKAKDFLGKTVNSFLVVSNFRKEDPLSLFHRVFKTPLLWKIFNLLFDSLLLVFVHVQF